MNIAVGPPTGAEKTLEAQRLFRQFAPSWSIGLFFADVIGFITAATLAVILTKHDVSPRDLVNFFLYSSYVFVIFWIALFYWVGLYRQSLALSVRDEFYYIVAALSVGIVPQMFVFTIVPTLSSSRLILLLSALFAVLLVGGFRAIAHAVRSTFKGLAPQRIAVIGDYASVAALLPSLTFKPQAATYRIRVDSNLKSAPAFIDSLGNALERAKALHCDAAILSNVPPPLALPFLAEKSAELRMRISFAIPDLRFASCGLRLDRSGDQVLIEPLRLRACTPGGRLLKRLFDLAFAVPILVVALPFMIGAVLAIWLEDGFPVLYRQERIGRAGVPFLVCKFRTMRTDLANTNWAVRGDSRITKVGAFLRRTSIDELPQIFNVLLGDMSLVGPRPEMRTWADDFSRRIPRYTERHLVRPGITGWSQIYMKRLLDPSDTPDVLKHDLFYIEHWGLLMDLSIVCKTAAEFLFHRST